jgi:hypothetical protein
MLSTTYVLTTIYIEERNARDTIQSLRSDVLSCLMENGASGFNRMDTLLQRLISFDSDFRARKIDVHVIPAISARVNGKAAMLGKLMRLKERAACALRDACEQMDTHLDEMSADDILLSMSLYCELMLETIEMEAEELLPALSDLLQDEEWFSIAARLSRNSVGRVRAKHPLALQRPVSQPASRLHAEAYAA